MKTVSVKGMRSLWAVLMAAMSCGTVLAQDAPKYSNEFLAIGVGARALGMGSAYTAVVNDVTSGYWNPAGLLTPFTRWVSRTLSLHPWTATTLMIAAPFSLPA